MIRNVSQPNLKYRVKHCVSVLSGFTSTSSLVTTRNEKLNTYIISSSLSVDYTSGCKIPMTHELFNIQFEYNARKAKNIT